MWIVGGSEGVKEVLEGLMVGQIEMADRDREQIKSKAHRYVLKNVENDMLLPNKSRAMCAITISCTLQQSLLNDLHNRYVQLTQLTYLYERLFLELCFKNALRSIAAFFLTVQSSVTLVVCVV